MSKYALGTTCSVYVKGRTGRAMASELRRLTTLLFMLALLTIIPSQVKAQSEVHVIQPGEHLATIANSYGIDVNELIAINGLGNPNHIVTGQQLIIPQPQHERYSSFADLSTLPGSGGYHLVARGESLSEIAKAYGMTITDLMRINGISNANFVWVGQQLRVTTRVAATAYDQELSPQAAETIYVVGPGDSLAQIAKDHATSVEELLVANGLPNPNFVYSGQRLRVRAPAAAVSGMGVAGARVDGKRWIEIDLSNQTITAWQGDLAILHTDVSTGKSETPTVTGTFEVGTKYTSQHMYGDGYDLPGVPWAMYFYSGYAIHGAYWHTNFGTPMILGCINMRIDEAKQLYDWAPAGTEVYVHY